jgi:hypothetical protein
MPNIFNCLGKLRLFLVRFLGHLSQRILSGLAES